MARVRLKSSAIRADRQPGDSQQFMSDLEGNTPLPPSKRAIAYLTGEATDGAAEPGESTRVYEDTVDGDVVEAASNTDLEILRRQVDERAEAATRADQTTIALRCELAAARAEAASLRESLLASQGVEKPEPADPEAVSRLISDAFAEMAKVRTDSLRVRKDLEKERTERRAEMIQARAQVHSAQDELQQLVTRRVQTVSRPAPVRPPSKAPAVAARPKEKPREIAPNRRWPISRILAGSALVGILGAVTVAWVRNPDSFDWPASPPPAEVPAKVPLRPPPKLPPIVARGGAALLTPAAQSQFQSAVARLNRLLTASRGRAPEDMLREIHDRYKAVDPTVCDFDWHKGEPSLVYAGGSMSLGQTIEHCADAIELNR